MGELSEEKLLAGIPETWWSTPYAGARFPGARSVKENPGLVAGANCQLFAYEVLRLYGIDVPAWRSSELWDDTGRTVRVSEAEPLDLALFNATENAWGAHVGVVVGERRVLHLSAEVGHPAVWSMADFAARDRYRNLIGFKRARRG
ncbi:hydrolase [Streptomyces acidicola]|uniref:hydrolase n=1 Tax=Streptomyces acidicola TaxID=2596892 RepID=UPI002AD568CB|nr:hydrolase [Streptomyces acidicola]